MRFHNIYGSPKKVGEKTFLIEIMAGCEITSSIKEAIAVARGLDAQVRFIFNGVTVMVRPDSDPELINRDWSRALHGYTTKKVGPYPNPVLSDRVKKKEARIKAMQERRGRAQEHEARKKFEAHRARIEAKLSNLPAMEVVNESAWMRKKDRNSDDFGRAIAGTAERWARLMQAEMAQGKKLEKVASATFSDADLDGISGAMYGIVVGVLAKYWKYGEQLRRWHNLDTQIGDEGEKANESGGVLNPALLVIGS